MTQESGDQRWSRSIEAYRDDVFLNSRSARSLRILSEYIEPQSRFEHFKIEDTIVFMGSARLRSREQAEQDLQAAQASGGEVGQAEAQRFVVCTGGGPGIMEAANRGASEADGLNVGLTISIPIEEFDNRYVTQELSFHFHYFFMRKFWFAYLAKAVVVFPGGFGTLDELFELLTLRQTQKMRKHLPIVLYGSAYWQGVVNFDALIDYGVINPDDVKLFHTTDSVDDAFEYLTDHLRTHALEERGAIL